MKWTTVGREPTNILYVAVKSPAEETDLQIATKLQLFSQVHIFHRLNIFSQVNKIQKIYISGKSNRISGKLNRISII